jgi:cobalt-zinc-cadmium efflux system outer membrane protein
MCFKSLFIATLAAAISSGARAQVPVPDAALRKLLDEAATASPEVAQAHAAVEAERAVIAQAGALPDPSLTLGIQNDGFKRIAIGTAETSFINIMVTQPLYWPGKRGLREQVATLGARRAEALLARASLDLEGRVRRAYLGWLLAQGQVELLAEQELLWTQAEQTARSRYEAGQAPQSDLLRAQLERARLQQRRWALDSEVAIRLAELNRLRGRPLDERVPAAARLVETADPTLLSEPDAVSDAEGRSPELLFSLLGVDQAGRRVELARKEERPDFAVTAAIMPRGSLEPMWSLGVTVGLPIFAGRKQERAVDENQQRQIGEAQGGEALRQILRLRTHQRLSTLASLNRTNQLYRSQILVLSAATTRSTLSQYEVGRVSFASVLEALSGYISDRASFLGSLAEAQLLAIAHQEVSLEPVSSASGGGSSGGMPGASTSAMRASGAAAGNQTRGEAESTSTRSTNGM